MKKKPKEYLWDKKTDKELLLMPETCVEHFLTNPTMPTNLKRGRPGAISSPAAVPIDLLGERGIVSASVSIHRKGFYLARSGVDFHLAIFTLGGEAQLSMGGKKSVIKKGSVFFAPAGSSFEYRALKDWRVFWFHLSTTGIWSDFSGESPQLKRSKFSQKINAVMTSYLEEVHTPTRSLRLLEAYADIMSEFLRRELGGGASAPLNLSEKLELILSGIAKNPQIRRDAGWVAAELKISKPQLHRLCQKNYSTGIAKLLLKKRMLHARELVERGGFTNAQIAAKTGYANEFAFSKAYKSHFGVAPKLTGDFRA